VCIKRISHLFPEDVSRKFMCHKHTHTHLHTHTHTHPNTHTHTHTYHTYTQTRTRTPSHIHTHTHTHKHTHIHTQTHTHTQTNTHTHSNIQNWARKETGAELEVFVVLYVSFVLYADKTTRRHNPEGHNRMNETCFNVLRAK